MTSVGIGSSCIPHDIVLEILKTLPTKSLIRFRCLSKSFRSLISEPLFIEAHQKSHAPQFLVNRLALTSKAVIYNFGLREEHQEYLPSPIPYLNQPCFRDFCFIIKSINGLVCLWNNVGKVAICNPFTKQHVFLPHQHHTEWSWPSMTCCSFGFDAITKKHKVIKAYVISQARNLITYRIFTIGMDNSWREISGCPNFQPTKHNCVCIGGVVYFVNKLRCDIVAFSVSDEKFIGMIPFPDEAFTLSLLEFSPRIADIKGQVALLDHTVGDDSKIVLYVLNGFGETDIWVKHTVELPLESIKVSCCSLFTTNDTKGEILLTLDIGMSKMFLYDIGRKEWRVVEIHKICEREFLLENIWPVK